MEHPDDIDVAIEELTEERLDEIIHTDEEIPEIVEGDVDIRLTEKGDVPFCILRFKIHDRWDYRPGADVFTRPIFRLVSLFFTEAPEAVEAMIDKAAKLFDKPEYYPYRHIDLPQLPEDQ